MGKLLDSSVKWSFVPSKTLFMPSFLHRGLRSALLLVPFAIGSPAVLGDLVHRWSFNEAPGNASNGTTLTDSVSSAVATVRGEYITPASFDGAALRLPGTSDGNHSLGFMSAYLDLPNGIISSKTNLTVEIWATPHSVTAYDRLFDFGRSDQSHGPGAEPGELAEINGQGQIPGNRNADDTLYYSFGIGNDENGQRLEAMINDTANPGLYHDAAQATNLGTRYHYVFTFEDSVGAFGSDGGRVSWYRDGTLIHTADVDFHLSEMEDVNNWLGRSQWTTDWNADASYDEVRIWDHALTPAEISANLAAGPDSLEDPDTDDDGLLDVAFEDHYFGNDDGTASQTELDLHDGDDNPDGDAYTNLQEQAMGTDPTDPLSPPPPPTPDHLWTFTVQADSTAESGTVFTDEIGGVWEATLVGQGGQFDGRQVILPGSTTGNQPLSSISAYLDLSNGIVSDTPSVTFEAWATPISSKNWQRLFDFGRTVSSHGGGAPGEIVDDFTAPGLTDAYDNLSLTFNDGGDINTQQLEGEYDNTGMDPYFSSAATTPGQEYHYALVVEDGVGIYGAAGIRASWYRDGVLQNSADFNFRLVDMEDVNNWIGRSMYSGDSNAHMALNELRIHRSALSPAQIISSMNAGADPSSGPPEPPTPAPIPIRLWDFNTAPGPAAAGTVFNDASSDGEEATVRGNNAELTGTELLIGDDGSGGRQTTGGAQSGDNISAYLELPNGFISSFTDLSIEAWITPRSSGNWQRTFDFGNCTVTHGSGALPGEIIDDGTAPAGFEANDNIFLSMNVGGDLNAQRFAAKIGSGAESANDNSSLATTPGTEYHYVLTVEDGAGANGASGCRIKWYRDGALVSTIDLPFRLQDMEDVNNWIGRSNWSQDQNSHLSINELRVYDRTITPQEIGSSFDNGTDVGFAAPTAQNDTATLHRGQKVLVQVLANDSGGIDPGSVTIGAGPAHGTVSLSPDGSVLYTHDDSGTAPDSFTYTVSGIGGTSSPATVDITIATDLRIDNPAWAMPAAAPPTALTLVDALPGLTFTRPVCLTPVPGDPQQLYVSEQPGIIQRVADVTSLTPATNVFLDISGAVDMGPFLAGQPENGLLGLAFHPDYETNGYFYVAYTVNQGGNYFQRVSRFSRDAADPTIADPASELILLHIDDFGLNHNGGDLHFGPSDGYLYYGTGDGENSTAGQARSQKIDDDFYSGIFRIDVDKKPGSLEPNPHPSIPTYSGEAAFGIPPDNPFVHTSLGGDWDGLYNGDDYSGALGTVRTEFWATGIRHAWRMSFDPVTGDLWEGDVGQVTYEEINRIERGGNYGWAYREGAHDFSGVLGSPPAGWTSIDPIYDYLHNGLGGDANYTGNSVCGGYVYRGTRFPELYGYYIFCDSISGHIWQMDTATGTTTRIAGLPGQYGVFSSMGVDPSNQDILFCAYLTGKILRLSKSTDLSTGFPETLSETGLFSDLTDLSPAPGILPIQPNLKFWSDYADKVRWFGIPDDTSRMTYQAEGPWTYPTGMVWVKHFDLAMTRGNPATNKRIETRVLVKTDSGVYGVSYRWNEDETEAYLVEDAGVSFDLEIDDDGTPYTQTWGIPSRSTCITCHQDRPLSFYTRQINRVETMNGFIGNQIDLLHSAGYLTNDPDPVETLPAHVRPDQTDLPLEQRARSYLDVNCAYCHQDGGSIGGLWDGREELTLEATGMIHGTPIQNLGNPANEYIVPQDPLHSVILQRAGATNGFTRMPPVATNEVDLEGLELLTEWINSIPTDRLYDDWAAENLVYGGKAGDDDGDGRTNYDEFLLGTHPLSGADDPPLAMDGDELVLQRRAFRFYDIETSTNLVDWESWDVPENTEGYVGSDEVDVIPLSTSEDDRRFFRIEVREP